MGDLGWKGRRWSGSTRDEVVDVARRSVDGASSSWSGTSTSRRSDRGSCDEETRCCLTRFENLLLERKAYPLPHPMQFEKLSSYDSPPPVSDLGTRCGETEKVASPGVVMEQPGSSTSSPTEKQASPRNGGSDHGESSSSGRCGEIGDLGFLRHEGVKKAEASSSRVVVVYDGKKKFTTSPLDIAINGYATSEGDSILVVAFLDHVVSPVGMKMPTDTEQFRGVNDAVLKPAVQMKKMEIESKLRETARLQWCQMKMIHLDVKVLPGSNSKAMVAKEIVTFQATTAIFDKNAMKNRKYYEENLSCHVLRLRSDGRRVETISLFDQRLDRAGSLTAYCSSGSVGSEPSYTSPSIWSKLNIFGSKSSTTPFRYGGGGSTASCGSRTSSESGSPRATVVPEEEELTTVAEALEESFSFDTPKPKPDTSSDSALEESFSFDTPKLSTAHEAYLYAAVGWDDYNLYTRRRNRETLSTAVIA